MLREINLFPRMVCGQRIGPRVDLQATPVVAANRHTLLPPLLAQPKVYVHRDFIVRNLMLAKGRPGVLDFQDALYGPISYDLVSLLRDAFYRMGRRICIGLGHPLLGKSTRCPAARACRV